MKRSPLPKRTKPLRRSWLKRGRKRGRKRSRYSRRARDIPYLLWLKTQPCCRCGAPPPSQAHHAGQRGLGRKCPDDQSIALCEPCHRRIAYLGGWKSKLERREWVEDMISEHRSRYLAETGRH